VNGACFPIFIRYVKHVQKRLEVRKVAQVLLERPKEDHRCAVERNQVVEFGDLEPFASSGGQGWEA